MNNKDTDSFDPGAMRLGNFINYYQFHPPVERIRLLPSAIWQQLRLEDEPIVCLDLGCNCGDLTESLYENLTLNMSPTSSDVPNSEKKIKFLGIDIDETLITRAIEKNKYEQNISYKCTDIMEPSAMEFLTEYVRREKTNDEAELNAPDYGVTVPSNKKTSDRNFQGSLSVPATKPSKFNIVFCFSVTMWIHLNHGDRGLLEFLEKVASLGEYLVLENQPWKCYRNAQRRLVKNAGRKSIKETVGKEKDEKLEAKGEINEKSNNLTVGKEKEQEEKLESKAEINEERNKESDKTESSSHSKIESGSKEEAAERKSNSRRSAKKSDRKNTHSEAVGFKHYKDLKLRSDVDKDIDKYLVDKCKARKLYESESNEWGRVITVYECR